jgi:hypothetical protein
MPDSRFDQLIPELREGLRRAEAAEIWLTRPHSSVDMQGVYDLCGARRLLLSFEIAQARVSAARTVGDVEVRLGRRLRLLEAEVLALRAAGAPPADAPTGGPGVPCGVGWPPPRVTG